MRVVWVLFAALVLVQIGYPLTNGGVRAAFVVVTVVLGYATSMAHAARTRGGLAVAALLGVTALGFGFEAIGLQTGVIFGSYAYTDALGLRLAGVPLVIPLAWTWMAWPAWLVALRLVRSGPGRIALGAVALASWDLFLDPQMVSEGYWRWTGGGPGLPGVADVPVRNYLGWLLVAVPIIGLLALATRATHAADGPMYALYLWTYASSVLAHAIFLDLPASAGWGALAMGAVAVPLTVRLWRDGRRP